MRKDGTLESWDLLPLFYYRQELGPTGTMYSTPKQKRERNVDISTAMAYIDESMQDNQGWYTQDPNDPWLVTFPYATYLDKGDKFDCLDCRAEFTIIWVEEAYNSRLGRKTKTQRVRLSGPHVPDERHRLRPRSGKRLLFRKSYPKTMSPAYKFDENTQLIRNPLAWTDTITYMVTKRQPGAGSGEMFGRRKEIKPRFRESIEEDTDKTCLAEIEGQWFDNLVQFDIWAQSNERADLLLEWFEDFMLRYVWVWKYNGVQEILYFQRNQDALVTRWRNDIVHRSVEYFFRTERLRVHRTRRIVHLALTVDVANRDETPEDLIRSIVNPSEWPNFWTGVIPAEIVDNTGELIIQYPQVY